MDVSSPGPLCEEIGLYEEMLALDTIALMPIVDQRRITKGVVLGFEKVITSLGIISMLG